MEANNIEGKSICITGTLTFGRKRYIQFIKDHGGRFIREVSGNVDYVLYGEKCGIKKKLAKKRGIPLIKENQLYCMAGVGGLYSC